MNEPNENMTSEEYEDYEIDLIEDIKQELLEKEIVQQMENEEKAKIEALEEIEKLQEKQDNCEHEFQLDMTEQNDASYLWAKIKCSCCGIKFEGACFRK